jgi:hypothetical protein
MIYYSELYRKLVIKLLEEMVILTDNYDDFKDQYDVILLRSDEIEEE